MKKRIALIIVFLGHAASIQGMLVLQKGGARLQRAPGVIRHRNVPVDSVAVCPQATSPLAAGAQKKLYSSPTSQQTGLLGYISSFFTQNQIPELRGNKVAEVMHKLLYPEHTIEVVDMAGLKRQIRSFDEKDLEKAIDVLGRMIASNSKHKTQLVIVRDNTSWFGKRDWSAKNLRTEESLFNTILFSFYGSRDKWDDAGQRVIRYGFEGTILDEVLYKVFSGENSTEFYVTPASELYYILLAQLLSDMGVKINSENEKGYILGYERIMRAYKERYKPRNFARESMRLIDKESFKKIFAALDPILERVIENHELKQELHQLQQERREIEADPETYRTKMIEQDRRDEYISRKAYKIEMEYRAR